MSIQIFLLTCKNFQQFPVNRREIYRLYRTGGQPIPLSHGQTNPHLNGSKIQHNVGMGKNKQNFSSELTGDTLYNSYRTFNPDQYQENSPEWQLAILRYLVDMKENGHFVQEISVDKVISFL